MPANIQQIISKTMSLSDSGDIVGTLAYLEDILVKNPNFAEGHYQAAYYATMYVRCLNAPILSYLNPLIISSRLGNWPKAVSHNLRATELRDSYPEAHLNLGW